MNLDGGVAIPMVGFGTWQLRGQLAYQTVRHSPEHRPPARRHGVVVIPKSARAERIEGNLDLFSFSLTADEVERLNGL